LCEAGSKQLYPIHATFLAKDSGLPGTIQVLLLPTSAAGFVQGSLFNPEDGGYFVRNTGFSLNCYNPEDCILKVLFDCLNSLLHNLHSTDTIAKAGHFELMKTQTTYSTSVS
jgi:hypothetical protein